MRIWPLLAAWLLPAAADAADCHPVDPAVDERTKSADVRVVDAELLDQRGEAISFAELASGDQVLVIDFVFTHCTTICPVLTATFARVQERLAPRLGKEVRLVSITLDPARDTPERLGAFAARHRAGPGWTWLTGPRGEVVRVLQGLGAWTPDYGNHPPMVLVGDPRSGAWTRFNGFVSPEQIAQRVEELLVARSAEAKR